MNKLVKKMLMILGVMMLVLAGVGTTTLTVEAAKKPTKLTLKTTYKTVDIGGTVKVSVKSVKPSGASKLVTYKSSNEKIATISSTGVVTGNKAGTVTITATSKSNKKVKATIKITVKDLKPTSLSLNKSKYTGYEEEEFVIKAKVKPSNSNQQVVYSSSNKKVATVDSSGKVVLCSPGKATISVKTNQKNSKGKYVSKTVVVTVKEMKPFTGTYIIDANTLKRKMDAGENIIIVDTRGIKSNKTTIKGAITFDWKDISRSERTDGTKTGKAGYARTLDAKTLSTILSKKGLGLQDEIILVSDNHAGGGWGDDGRMIFQLLQCGYKNLKMLDGGITAMKETCGESWGDYSQVGPSEPVAKNVKIKSVNQSMNSITTEKLLSWYKQKKKMKVVDVRTDKEYNGAVLYKEVSGGHLKNAIHIRFTDMFNKDHTLKSKEALVEMFSDAGLKKSDYIIPYCTGGIRSGYMTMVLRMCGYKNALNYTESTYRWSNTKSAGTSKYWVK